ncbi:tmem1 family protein [Neofusicoccum parvum]|uniref:Tmem1 family protein n=1 Tax=Neofusicoccum parvum TaxID=310453 RepID=A0ACB5SJT7_9PEZI|nr:tmem1 family protein [Neofusicoccum parvum]
MAASSSSKVTVEYHDPSGLFNILEPHLRARLPLRNLHWKSPSRPLRSIDSLHVDFVPGRDPTDDFLKSLPPSNSNDGRRSRAASAASMRPGSSDGRSGRRRHQIPGLSQTPYLKLFILRCDDNDAYKVSSRKLLREWVKDNTPPSESGTKSTQENHDAFEWLILHVVLPDTPAAAQPRLSGSASASTGAIEKSSSGSRWPGRGSTTIFEKIRSDFNSASKSAPDRVSQIRLEMKDIPPHLIPHGIGQSSNPYNDSPQEILNSWSDTIIKFKTLILSSFDLRVRQYEEDIKEKDAQRHLPGWNFNTFFVLKEGLARGFESVGLVEDALVGYDELSVGLDSIIRERAADGYGGSFLEYTEDLKQQLLVWLKMSPKENKFTEVSLDDDQPVSGSGEEQNGDSTASKDENLAGLCENTLRIALDSNEDFRNIYEQLSDLAVKHYFAANRSKSAESIMGDLAALKFESGDFSAAATYFSRMAPLYAQNRWNLVEVTMLKMYAQCLKKLNRKDEYVRVLLDLLAKSASNRKPSLSLKMRRASIHTPWLNDDHLDTTGILQELVKFSDELPYDVPAPMSRYFSDVLVDPYIQHYEDKDGFQMRLSFRHLLEDDIEIDKAKIRLVSIEPGENRDVWLETSEKLELKQGQTTAWLHSHVVTLGYYAVDKIVLEAKKIHFTHETMKKEETLQPLGITIPGVSASSSRSVPKRYRVLSYPRADAFDAKLTVARAIHIDKIKSLELDCHTFANNTATKISIPYELEVNLSELHIKLDIVYHTEQGEHEFRANCTINIELPLDVNVHDQFMERMLLSTFKVTTSNHVPLDVLNIQLKGTPAFDVDPAKLYGSRNPVRPGQPPAFVYRISRKEGSSLANLADSNLSLSINYRCLDDHVYEELEKTFSKALQESKFANLSRLLFPRLWENLKVTLTSEDWHRASFNDELRCGPFEDAGWMGTIESLPSSIREELQDWLSEWHKASCAQRIQSDYQNSNSHSQNNPTIDVTPPKDRTEAMIAPITRRITITVAVPRVQILNIAHLDLKTPVPSPAFTPPIAPLGVPLSATLRIKHTRKWDDAATLAKTANLADPSDPVSFVYEVETDPHVWLLGGARRVQFEAREGEVRAFPLTLIPLREGYPRWLPAVSIRPVVKEDAEKESRDASRSREREMPHITCEMDLISQHACVQVVPDWKSVTVGVGVFGSEGGGVRKAEGEKDDVGEEKAGGDEE